MKPPPSLIVNVFYTFLLHDRIKSFQNQLKGCPSIEPNGFRTLITLTRMCSYIDRMWSGKGRLMSTRDFWLRQCSAYL